MVHFNLKDLDKNCSKLFQMDDKRLLDWSLALWIIRILGVISSSAFIITFLYSGDVVSVFRIILLGIFLSCIMIYVSRYIQDKITFYKWRMTKIYTLQLKIDDVNRHNVTFRTPENILELNKELQDIMK